MPLIKCPYPCPAPDCEEEFISHIALITHLHDDHDCSPLWATLEGSKATGNLSPAPYCYLSQAAYDADQAVVSPRQGDLF